MYKNVYFVKYMANCNVLPPLKKETDIITNLNIITGIPLKNLILHPAYKTLASWEGWGQATAVIL